MSPGVTGNKDAFNADAVDVQYLAVPEKNAAVVGFDHRQFIQAVEDLSAHFASEIAVLRFPDIDCGIAEELLTVIFQRTDMIGILEGDENVPDRGRINVQPAHLFLQPGIIIARIDHDGGAVFCIEENIGNPFADAAHARRDPSGVQGLEDRFSAEQDAHGHLLVF